MLSRFARPAFVRRAISSAPAAFSVISAQGKTEAQLINEFNNLPGFDANENVAVSRIADDAYQLTPVDDQGLLDSLAQAAVDREGKDAPQTEGLLDAIGLGPFHRKAALLATGAITAISNEFYVMNEETFVAACLFAGFTTMHVLLREPALEAYKSFQEETLKAQQDAENKHIAACKTLIKAQSGSGEIVDAVKEAFAEKEQLVHAEATARAIAEKNKVAKDFEGKLQALVNRKANEENKAYKALVDAVYADVLETVTSDAKFQKSALKYAVAAIATPEKAGANPTVALYEAKLTQ